MIDSHAAIPAAGICTTGKMFTILGTSACHIIMTKERSFVPGTAGPVKNSTIPGLYSFEAGQTSVGDTLSWYVENQVSTSYKEEADKGHISLHELLSRKASALKPGESGLLALDWWNGNCSPLADNELSGMLLGMTLHTKPEELYRALVESSAFGMKWIIHNYADCGITADEIYMTGGISNKNRIAVQWYTDILNKPIYVLKADQGPALGSAIYAAAAAGKSAGGYASVPEAIDAMSVKEYDQYIPIPDNAKIYEKIYTQFRRLTDYFGSVDSPMKVMRPLQTFQN